MIPIEKFTLLLFKLFFFYPNAKSLTKFLSKGKSLLSTALPMNKCVKENFYSATSRSEVVIWIYYSLNLKYKISFF